MPALAPLQRRALPAGLIAVALTAGACVGEQPDLVAVPERLSTIEQETTTTATTEPIQVGERAAEANGPSIDIFASEGAAAPDRQIVAGVDTSLDTIPVVFLVKSEGTTRLEVYLPVRPNGSIGWVNAADVTVASLSYRIEVTASEHRIRVYKYDEMILDEPVGVGRADLPTPGGVYYLKELLQPPDPNGSYGPYAYGLSGFSNVLSSFNGGSGVIGLHGTNEPDSIGTDVSHGCIRLNNAVIERLVNEFGLPLGTPVEIIA